VIGLNFQQRRTVPGGRIDALVNEALGPEARVALLASEWFGVDLAQPPTSDEAVPPMLRRLWDAAAENSMLCFQDRLLAEDQVELADDGSLVFLGENEWCWAASYRPGDGPNPQVYLDEAYGPMPSMIAASGMLLDEFLLREAPLAAKSAAPVLGYFDVGRAGVAVTEVLDGFAQVVDELVVEQFLGAAYWTKGTILASARATGVVMAGACRREDIGDSALGSVPTEAWSFLE